MGTKLWEHPSPTTTAMYAFLQHINQKHGLTISNYNELHNWSVQTTSAFWAACWDYVGIRASAPYTRVLPSATPPMFPRPPWFAGAKLNFAENLLYPTQHVDADAPAILAATEIGRETVTWAELRERVRLCQGGMLASGVSQGERVAGFVGNHVQALVAMLAATGLGAVWTAVSPDTGVTAVVERLRQIEPCLLVADGSGVYNGKRYETGAKIEKIVRQLPSLRKVVVLGMGSGVGRDVGVEDETVKKKVVSYTDFVTAHRPPDRIVFEQLDPDHPVYILYSSGTTGAPKCIVHGAIGTLLQHKKEHILHCDIRPGDRLSYFTTCTWMMWHWLVSGLASGATLVLYDGSPFRYLAPSSSNAITADTMSPATPPVAPLDDLAMPRLIDELGITHFGTSAKYLSLLEQKSLLPVTIGLHLSSLRAIYSTGSPLAPSTFTYVYTAFPSSINLGSITGGTDIISLFGAPCPLLPVHVGEIQCLGLGMDVRAWDWRGKQVPAATGEPGDLVATTPFPCQPVAFWGPDGEAKYRRSYFEQFKTSDGRPVWHHGDFVRFNPLTGGLIMLGRSDGILKPSGVRFGSAEIYNLLLEHFPDEVEDGLCIGRRRETDADETVVLFLKMKEGVTFTDALVEKIKKVVRTELSARHVPGVVDQCPEIPVTTNGKK